MFTQRAQAPFLLALNDQVWPAPTVLKNAKSFRIRIEALATSRPVTVWRIGRHMEDIGANLSADVGVASNDVRQSAVVYQTLLASRQGAFIPEAITIAQRRELTNQHGVDQFTHHGARYMILGQPTDPQVHVIHQGVG
jgi:hypothetical protein